MLLDQVAHQVDAVFEGAGGNLVTSGGYKAWAGMAEFEPGEDGLAEFVVGDVG